MRAAAGFIALGLVVRLALAAHWSLMADEAYYWVWAKHPALGYYDQPPLVAWIIAATRAVLGDTELGVRAGSVACAAIAMGATVSVARDRAFAAAWWLGVPSLFWLTLFQTSDAPLLAAWAVTLAAACKGGRYWLLAGVAGAAAFLSKYSGLAVLPLCVVAAGPRDWRTPWPWVALATMAALVAPNLWWNHENGWISFAFQLHEGLVNPHPTGLVGLWRQTGDQVLVLGPLTFVAFVAWAATIGRSTGDRVQRLCWAVSVPIYLLFAAAASMSPAEAHWPAIAYVGLGVGLSFAAGRLRTLARAGLGLGIAMNAALAVHGLHPLVDLPDDPGTRLTEGPLVARGAAAQMTRPIFTQRYQEAALIEFYARVPAFKLPGCGRRDQYDLWGWDQEPTEALFVRPATHGLDLCTDARWPKKSAPVPLDGVDRFGRVAGRWQAFDIQK